MENELDAEDWERILFALSHFRHNDKFLATLLRVEAYLAAKSHRGGAQLNNS